MITRLATAEAVNERLTPASKSVALKLRVYSEPERVVGMLIWGMSIAVQDSRRSMNDLSILGVIKSALRQVRTAFAASITLLPPIATTRSALQLRAATTASVTASRGTCSKAAVKLAASRFPRIADTRLRVTGLLGSAARVTKPAGR